MRYTATRVTPLMDALGEMFPDSTKTTLRQMLMTERVRVNGEVEKVAKRLLAPGDKVEYARREHHALLGTEIPILYEDDDLLVVIKPAGLLTVATEGERDDTLQNRLNAYLKAKGTRDRVHVVHRLDRESSGVLVFAKAFEMRESLKELFAVHELDRVYVAIVEGRIEPPMGTIRSHLWEGKDLQVRSVELRAFPNAKPAVTHYRTIRSGGTYSCSRSRSRRGGATRSASISPSAVIPSSAIHATAAKTPTPSSASACTPASSASFTPGAARR